MDEEKLLQMASFVLYNYVYIEGPGKQNKCVHHRKFFHRKSKDY